MPPSIVAAFLVSFLLHATLIIALPGGDAKSKEGSKAGLQLAFRSAPAAKKLPHENSRPTPQSAQPEKSAPPLDSSDYASKPESRLFPYYHPPSELDERPVIVTPVDLQFPPSAPATPGQVVIEVFVNSAGTVDRVANVDASLPGDYVREAAMAFAQARFRPATIRGIAVASRIKIEVTFSLLTPLQAEIAERVAKAPPATAP